MADLTIDVKGMTCDHCVRSVSGAVTAVAGVAGVDVDLATGKVTIAGDSVDASAVRGAIVEAGYEPVA